MQLLSEKSHQKDENCKVKFVNVLSGTTHRYRETSGLNLMTAMTVVTAEW
jgi:hypothetical protein